MSEPPWFGFSPYPLFSALSARIANRNLYGMFMARLFLLSSAKKLFIAAT
jgi:hypothetical protein